MAILTAGTLVRTYALYHLIIAFYLISSPSTIANHPLVSILGASMRIPPVNVRSNTPSNSASQSSPFHPPTAAVEDFVTPTAGLSLAALFLAILGIADFVTEVLPDAAYSTYWIAQTSVRLPTFFLLCAWIYVFKPVEDDMNIGVWGDAGWGGAAKNNLVFTLGFVEVIYLFWMFSALREEKVKIAPPASDKQRKGVKET